MIDWNRVGPALALTLAGAAVAGAILLISLDFASAEGASEPLADRLKGVTAISLFVKVAVPGTNLEVHTGTEYADAAALAAGHDDNRWCYIVEAQSSSAMSQRIALGVQDGQRPPVFTTASTTEAEARTLGASIDELVTIAHRDCRFDEGKETQR